MKGSHCVHFTENSTTPGEFDTCYNAHLGQIRAHGLFAEEIVCKIVYPGHIAFPAPQVINGSAIILKSPAGWNA